ncbi:MAG: acetyl-CoA acetyltransferase [Microthrixaceae bacterium]|jgi:acetyl-CoA C-acetyltransferase|nr:acetyl-CoA acetyltransferase [Microthrixaceae bacterium]
MPSTSTIDPRWPVLVGVGQVEQRTEDFHDALSPDALLVEAALKAQADSGTDGLLGSVDTVAVIRILSWRYRDPGALVARRLGISPRHTIVTDDGGNYPQTLVNRACLAILAGTSDAVLIGGAETWRTRSHHKAADLKPDWPVQDDSVEPAESVANKAELWHPGEWARRVMLPIEFYPLFENAYRAARGWTIDDHRDRVAQLWSGFSEVAATNPNAWIRRAFDADAIRTPTPDNRMVGFPYTKLMNANNAVEQAAAFVVCSVERARSLGVSSDRWVFPWTGTDAHEHWHVSNRWSLAEAPAIRVAGRRALELAGVGADDVAHADVYSCFPSAVQIAANEIGLGTDRPLTVTGGLSFAGGPWNNYVSHSISAMVERLRSDPGTVGLITANGGFLTKHAFGVYSTRPPDAAFRHADVQDEVDAGPSRALAEIVDPTTDGTVTVETSTVMHDRTSTPERAILSTLLADGRRAWAGSTDTDVLRELMTVETAGRHGTVDADGTFTFTD